jgi:hypothetical protein
MERDVNSVSTTPERVAELVDRGVGGDDIVRSLVATGTWSEAGAMEIVFTLAPATAADSGDPGWPGPPRTRRRCSLPERRTEEDLEMPGGFVHTVYRDGRWVSSLEGDQAPLPDFFETREDAVDDGRAEARRRETEHVIHNQDGSIAERNSYGKDPISRRG